LGGIENRFHHKNRYFVKSIGAIFNYMCRTFKKLQIWLVGVESTLKVGIIEIGWHESCSPQRFIVDEWLLLSLLEATFSRGSTKSLVVLWSWKFSISKYCKTSFSIGVQTGSYKGFHVLNHDQSLHQKNPVSICIFDSPFSMLISTYYCSTTCRVARPSCP